MTKTRADYALPLLTPPRQLPCMTGRLKYFQANWRKITKDPWILQTISGYHIPFIKRPWQIRPRITRAKTLHQQKLLQDAITELINKQAITMVTDHQTDQFISTLFVLQQTNKTRPVFNLRHLNTFVETTKFKMEGLALLRSTLRENDYMMKLDLKDAYFSIPIAEEHRKYLRFIFNDLLYEFQCLPFGLSTAPRTFTKVLKPVIALLRQRGLRVIVYLDDLLLLHPDPKELAQLFREVCQMLTDLGFLVKKEKCSTEPVQSLVFLGALINSVTMTLAVPQTKLQELQDEAQSLKERQICSIQELSALLGRMTQMSKIGMESAPLHYRSLQKQHIKSVHRYGILARKQQISLTPESMTDLEWWTSAKPMEENSVSITAQKHSITIQTDASRLGWGAVCQGEKTGSHWSTAEQEDHINVLELKAAHLAIQSFLKKDVCQLPGKRLLLQMDNTTAVAYINKRGGSKSNQLTQLVLKIWELCQSHKIMLIAQYIPGIENVEADAESRQMNARTEWALAKHLFVKIRTRYYTPEVDLFASRLNHQVPLYVARRPDPGAMAIDAFTLDWSQWTSFIHPPIVLLGRILLKIRQDKATALLIAPAWLDSRGTRHCWRCWSTGQPNFQHHRQQSSSHSIRQLFIRCGRH